MSSLKSLLAVGACALLLALTGIAAPQTLSISGVVDTTDGKPLPHVEVRVITVGGTVTSDSGEFSIALPSQFEPGVPVLLSVRDWVIIDPYDGESGETYVRKRSTDLVRVAVARKGDRRLLSDARLIQQIVQGVKSQLEPKLNSAPSPDAFLAAQANELGFTLDQLKSAINDWSKNVQGPYQKGLAALYAGRYAEASEHIRDSLNPSEADLVNRYLLLATAEVEQLRYAEAEGALLKAYAIRPEDATVLNNLGLFFTHEARYKEAEPLLQRALAINKLAFGPENPNVARSLSNLALLYNDQRMYTEAEPLLKQALAIDEKTLGPEHPDVAIRYDNLAGLYLNEGRYAEAEPLFKRALAIDEKTLGPKHPRVAIVLNNLAALYSAEGRYAEAEPLYRQALEINEGVFGAVDLRVAASEESLAHTLYDLGRDAEAKTYEDQAAKIRAKTSQAPQTGAPEDHPR